MRSRGCWSPRKAIARHVSPGPSYVTTAQPGRCSRAPRAAGRLLAWQTDHVLNRSRRHRSDRAERPQVAAFPPLLPARSYSAVGRGGTIALGLRGPADAIEKAIARRMPPASSCMTTAQPGRTSSPPRPARRLLAWQRHSEPEQPREPKQSWRDQVPHAWIWAIGAARDSSVGAVRRHLGTSIDAPRGLLLRSGR